MQAPGLLVDKAEQENDKNGVDAEDDSSGGRFSHGQDGDVKKSDAQGDADQPVEQKDPEILPTQRRQAQTQHGDANNDQDNSGKEESEKGQHHRIDAEPDNLAGN